MILSNTIQERTFTPLYLQLLVLCAVSGFSFSFIHEIFWALVFGSVFFLTLHFMLDISDSYFAKKRFYFLMAIILVITLALLWGAINQLYNLAGLIMLFCGFLVGYYISTVKIHVALAWFPFSVFLAYFTFCWLSGVDSNSILPRNSRNYISIIMLGLFATALLLSKPWKPSLFMYLAAISVFFLSVWAEGRGGILSSFLLILMIIASRILSMRITFSKQLIVLVILLFGFLFLSLSYMGFFDRVSERGFSDYSRARIISEYFSGISVMELFMGRDYDLIAPLGHYGFNLHNSFLAAWASGGFLYFVFILSTILVISFRFFSIPMLAVAVIPLSVRAITDTQVFFGKYDYVLIAAAFMILAKRSDNRKFLDNKSQSKCENLERSDL